MRFFVAKDAPQNDGRFFGGEKIAAALDTFAVWATFGKAAAEPPHSKVGWAELALLALRDAFFCGRRAPPRC
jgi:hypothetical protein